MHEDRSVILAFIDVLTTEFIHRGRLSIRVEAVGQRAGRELSLVSPAEVMPIISDLIQRLTITEAQVFRQQDDRLALTEDAVCNPATVGNALQSFRNGIASRLKPSTESTEKVQASQSEREVLDDFFRGFDREIMRARLGEDGNQDRG